MSENSTSIPIISQLLESAAKRTPEGRLKVKHHDENPPLPANPDEAAAEALAAILDPSSKLLPGDVFKELARRNIALQAGSEVEIRAAIARQISLLEATAIRLHHRAATTSETAAATEFLRAGLATQRVLLQALGACHQMDKDATHGAAIEHHEP